MAAVADPSTAPAPPPAAATPRRIALAPCPTADVARLEAELGVSHVLAQVLVRRGLADPAAAAAWLDAEETHEPSAFCGMGAAVDLVRDHLGRGSRITVHGDYDVDGVCSTAILVRALRSLGGDVGFYLPSRLEDGYGLNPRTVERLAAGGTGLLITVDCAITAVDEVAAARAAGMDVLVTDHHTPRADGVLPDAPIVHPALCGYPCADLCAAGVALKLAQALGAPTAAEDLDLAAMATVADVVSLRGENRSLVRAGLRALATTTKPGLRALMRVARVDATKLDARAVGFRLAPRINAAGRLYRADAGLELVLTTDETRAAEVADELDRANAERRHTEQQILFAAEAQVADLDRERAEAGLGPSPAYVLAGEGWHPGVVGIVASRIAERRNRPAVLVALDRETGRGVGSGRSIPAFDLLGGLNACAPHLLRHGGHRAAAGMEIEAPGIDAFRTAFCAHTESVLGEEDLVREERVDAVASGGDLALALCEELERLAPFGHGNPAVSLLVPAARLGDARPMGEGRHVRFTVEAGGTRARAVAFGMGKLPVEAGTPVDATFTLELDDYNGAVEPRLVLRHAEPCAPAPVTLTGEPEDELAAALAEHAVAPDAPPGVVPLTALPARVVSDAAFAGCRDRRDAGVAGTLGSLVASGEPLLVVCADARARRRHLAGRLGGFSVCSWLALEREPALAAGFAHVVVLDPPALAAQAELLSSLAAERPVAVHLAWGGAEAGFAESVHARDWELRAASAAAFRALRDGSGLAGVIAATGCPRLAGRALRVLDEVGLAEVDARSRTARLRTSERTDLERSATFRAARARLASATGVAPASATTAARRDTTPARAA